VRQQARRQQLRAAEQSSRQGDRREQARRQEGAGSEQGSRARAAEHTNSIDIPWYSIVDHLKAWPPFEEKRLASSIRAGKIAAEQRQTRRQEGG
jgi:hypothetical protein